MSDGLNDLKNLRKKRDKQFEKDKELIDKMVAGTTIRLMNTLSGGSVVYECPITKRTIDLENYKQIIEFNYEQFISLINNHRGLLEEYALIPIDINVSDYDAGEKDVMEECIRVFGLTEIYPTTTFLYEDVIEDIFEKLDYKAFSRTMDTLPLEFVRKIAKRASSLAKKNKFEDARKINYFIKLTDNEELFTPDKVADDEPVRKIR